MNLIPFVKSECANQTNGECLGCGLKFHRPQKPRGSGKPVPVKFHKGKCLISQRKRCPYFERALLPLAEQQGEARVIKQYAKMVKEPFLVSKIRYCDCGEPIGFRERLCERCRRQKRRDSIRESQTRRRLSAVNS